MIEVEPAGLAKHAEPMLDRGKPRGCLRLPKRAEPEVIAEQGVHVMRIGAVDARLRAGDKEVIDAIGQLNLHGRSITQSQVPRVASVGIGCAYVAERKARRRRSASSAQTRAVQTRTRMMVELAKGALWTDYQPLTVFGLPLGRRVAVARGEAGQLVVFSPLEGTDAAVAGLRRLGEIAAFVVPSRLHDRFYEEYFELFPRARFLASRAVMADHPRWPLTELRPDAPELSGFAVETIAGMPQVQEQVFVHRASRTLIIADAFFNLPRASGVWTRFMLRAAGMGGRPRPSRLFRTLVRDRAAFVGSVERVAGHDFERIVPGHGDVVAMNGKGVWREAFEEWLGR